MPGTVCFLPCLCFLFPSRARASQLSVFPLLHSAPSLACGLPSVGAGQVERGEKHREGAQLDLTQSRFSAGDQIAAASRRQDCYCFWKSGGGRRGRICDLCRPVLARPLKMFCSCFAAVVLFPPPPRPQFPVLSCHFLIQPGRCDLLVPPGSKHPGFPGHYAPLSQFLTKHNLKLQKW